MGQWSVVREHDTEVALIATDSPHFGHLKKWSRFPAPAGQYVGRYIVPVLLATAALPLQRLDTNEATGSLTQASSSITATPSMKDRRQNGQERPAVLEISAFRLALIIEYSLRLRHPAI
jgi:hypothetical protein